MANVYLGALAEARELTHGFSALLSARDIAASGRAMKRVAEELEALVRAPDLEAKVRAENPEALRQIMGLSLDLSALRMNIRRGGWLFRLFYHFSIRRFYRTAERITRASDAVRAHLPKPERPTDDQLAADADDLSHLIEEDGEWVDFGEVLQEDRERW